MNWTDEFPADMTASAFVEQLDRIVKRPVVTARGLATESQRIEIALEEGARDLVDKLVAWSMRKD